MGTAGLERRISLMNTLIGLLAAMLLCVPGAALAEYVPSMTTGDLTSFEVISGDLPEDAAVILRPVGDNEATRQEHIDICQNEIRKLAAENAVETYFGEVKDAGGNAVDLKDILETPVLNVYEFCPFVVENYKEAYGNVTTKLGFSTLYEKAEKVVVMVGLVAVHADGTQSIEWVALDGVGAEDGCIEVEFDARLMNAVQNGTAIVSIISK